ncbi:MAG: MBL fold metallo-hydrolase [Ostreibacterium sp.]
MASYIHTLELGPLDNFIHIIADANTSKALVVDPAWDALAISRYCDHHQVDLVGILLTHSHADHVSAIPGLLAEKSLPVYLSREEFHLGLVKLNQPSYVMDSQEITLGDSLIQVIATPGHTIGGVCYQVDNHLIVGDTLFIDGCGRCNFHESDVNKMWGSLQRLKQLPDDTIIYCGHHYGQQKTDTLGQQKQTNPYLLIEDKAFFIEFRMHLQAQYRSTPFTPSSQQAMKAILQKHL